MDGTDTPCALVKTDARTLVLIDVASGEECWRWVAPPGTFIGDGAGFKVEPGPGGAALHLFPTYATEAWCFDFAFGRRTPAVRWHRSDLPYDAGFGPSVVLADMDARRPERTGPLEPDRHRLPQQPADPHDDDVRDRPRAAGRRGVAGGPGSGRRPGHRRGAVRSGARRAARQRAAVRAAPGGAARAGCAAERRARQLPGRGVRGRDAPDRDGRPAPPRRLVRREGLADRRARAAAAADVPRGSARRRPAAARRRTVAGRRLANARPGPARCPRRADRHASRPLLLGLSRRRRRRPARDPHVA